MNTEIETSQYYSELVNSSLLENGEPIRLHFIIHKPKAAGPFPVLIFNHGSTGHGTNQDDFKTHEDHLPVSDFFVKRNWMVIIPHRRGRGDSDGKYDEGLDENGYSSNFEVSMLGLDRAVTDLTAAMEIIMSRKDVDKTNIVIGGQSRGGILSIAFAGEKPEIFKGVISFVGGWYGEGASTSFQINSEIACKGSKFKGNTLWLNAGKDYFYSTAHCKLVFDAFIKSGGSGEFIHFENAGHDLIWSNFDWQSPLSDYMVKLGYNEFLAKQSP